MEQKLDGLVARFGDSDASSQRQTSIEPSSQTALHGTAQIDSGSGSGLSNESSASLNRTRDDQAAQTAENLQDLVDIHDFSNRNGDDNSFNPTGAFGFQGLEDNNPREHHDVLKDIISDSEAKSLLAEYRDMTCAFPFVPIPPNISVQELHARKPMLLLAIVTVATWKDRTKQTSLSERYRHELAQRAIIQPQKNISLVQSLLVYLSW